MNSSTLRRSAIYLIPLLLLGLFIGYRVKEKKAEAADQRKQSDARAKAAPLVSVAIAKSGVIVKTYEAIGSVEAPIAVDITPKVSGRVLFLSVREGDRVRAGQVLARLDTAEIDAEVRQKEATVAQAQSRLAEASLTQGAEGANVATEVARQRAAVTTAQAQAGQARADVASQIGAAQSAVTDAQARIEAADANIASAEATVTTARANLANARLKQSRQEALFKEGATARENVDNAITETKVAEGALGEAVQKAEAARAARNSAVAQRKSAERQVAIVQNKASADVAATRAGVAQARASLTAANANTSRAPAYQKNLQALQATVRAAQADLRASEARRGDTTLLAPISGVVTVRNADPGALASPTQPLLTIQNIQQVWVAAPVTEEVQRRVFVGQPVTVRFDALPGKTYTGRITQSNPSADPQSRQFTVRVRLSNEKNELRPGIFGRVTFETEREKGVLVPLEAVKRPRDSEAGASAQAPSLVDNADAAASAPKGPTVTVVSADNKAVTMPVQTGLSNADRIVVRSGLKEGEKVIILAGRDIKDGTAVKLADSKNKRGGGADGNAAGGAGGASPAQGADRSGSGNAASGGGANGTGQAR